MDDYVELSMDVFDEVGQVADVRLDLTVGELINEILREFKDLPGDSPAGYALYLKGKDMPLAQDKTVKELGLRPATQLTFGYARQAVTTRRQPFTAVKRAILQETTTGKRFLLTWQPAVIGRPSEDPTQSLMLAANVEPFPNSQRVSRRHAQITVQGGQYYLESLNPQNPTYINDEAEPLQQPRLLQTGDLIRLGSSKIGLRFILL
ncbi:MAG: FHA domain-containing protein [Chloroflexota bacterium]